jgi:GDP-mannose 6-dehydrogenase
VLDLAAEKTGVFGLAFMENTDDLRENPAVALIERSVAKAREVRIFAPHVRIEKVYGSNRDFCSRPFHRSGA